jgi:hypothetical protein
MVSRTALAKAMEVAVEALDQRRDIGAREKAGVAASSEARRRKTRLKLRAASPLGRGWSEARRFPLNSTCRSHMWVQLRGRKRCPRRNLLQSSFASGKIPPL